jgi:hypothetical protein
MSKADQPIYVLHSSDRARSQSKPITQKESFCINIALGITELNRSVWESFWRDVETYDELPQGCRALMHHIIRKAQQMDWNPSWNTVGHKNLQFLSGLPKMVWTKNQFVRRRLSDFTPFFSTQLHPAYAINGLAENGCDSEAAWFRSNPMIEFLIEKTSSAEVQSELSRLGYEYTLTVPWTFGQRFAGVKHLFRHPADNVHCHVYVLYSDSYPAFKAMYKDMCTTAGDALKIDENASPFRLPDTKFRFLFALNQVFSADNWKTSAQVVYLKDAFNLLRIMTPKDHLSTAAYIESGLVPSTWISQVVALGIQMGTLSTSATGSLFTNSAAIGTTHGQTEEKMSHRRLFAMCNAISLIVQWVLSGGEIKEIVAYIRSRITSRFRTQKQGKKKPHPEKRYL